MKSHVLLTLFAALMLNYGSPLQAQTIRVAGSYVPRLVSFSSTLSDGHGKAMAGIAGVAFANLQEPDRWCPGCDRRNFS